MKKVKKMAFGGSPAQTGMKPPVAKPVWQTVSKAANTSPSAPARPSGLSAVTKSVGEQQALFDKHMAQAAALPPAQRAKFAEQFQRAAASGDPSTVRPGGVSSVKPGALQQLPAGKKKGGAVKAAASRRGDGIAQRGKTKGRMV